MSTEPLPSVVVVGEGARVAAEGGSMIYRKWVRGGKGIEPGALVVVENPRGEVLGCGLYDTVGPVAVRMVWHWDCPFRDSREAIEELLRRAYRARRRLGFEASAGMGFRLVHSDGDGMPGLIIDVYDDLAVIQSSSIVWDIHLDIVADVLVKEIGVTNVYEKSVQRTRRDIGLEPRQRLLRGERYTALIEEGVAKFRVDARRGQKTGFFLDQRENRLMLEKLVAEGDVVADLFSYTGGFGIHALLAGARHAVFVDEDAEALKMLRENLRLNGISEDRAQVLEENVWRFLRRAREHGSEYDVVVVDPPAFIQERSHYERGAQAYQRLYAAAAALAKRLLFLSSCSAFLTREDFQAIVGRALARAKREYRILGGIRGVPPDHPTRLHAQHLDYLKAAFIHVEEARR